MAHLACHILRFAEHFESSGGLQHSTRPGLKTSLHPGALDLFPSQNLTFPGCCRATAREIASAMSYLHSLDILHGDLSGGNILLASSNQDDRSFTAKVGP